MLTVLPRSLFLHIPRTAGSWIHATVEMAVRGAYVDHTGGHMGLKTATRLGLTDGKHTFTFIRHPVTWYQSYWKRRSTGEWDPLGDLDACGDKDFTRFIDKVIHHKESRGYLSGLYAQYVGKDHQEIDSVGRYENLREDLISILQQAGETFIEPAIRLAPPYNVSKEGLDAEYAPGQEERIKEIEKAAMERYGYE